MTSNQGNRNKTTDHEWAHRWESAIRYLEPAEKHEFLKRLGQMADQDQFAVAVKKFLESSVDKNWHGTKTQLQNICDDKPYMKDVSSRTSFIFGANYYAALESQVMTHKEKADQTVPVKYAAGHPVIYRRNYALTLEDAQTMSAYMVHMNYSKSMYERVAKQSAVITGIADVVQYHKGIYAGNWKQCSDEEKSEYLTMVARASNYMLLHMREDKQADDQHIFTSFHRPRNKKIAVAPNIKGDTLRSGMYDAPLDQIVVNSRLNYTDAMQAFLHEKAHQLSAVENRRAKTDPSSVNIDDRCVYALYPNVQELFHDNASPDSSYLVYYNTPEERLARSAEVFVAPQHLSPEIREAYAQKIGAIFAQAPDAFDDVKTALDKMLRDIDAQKSKRASGEWTP